MVSYVFADIEKLEQFKAQSLEAIKEFQMIKDKFEEINENLLGKWEGYGADCYKKETDHILENVGTIKDDLETLNNVVIQNIIDNYNKLDQQLYEQNINPESAE